MAFFDPPRNGEGDRDAKRRGGGAVAPRRFHRLGPSTSLRLVPLPVPGRS